MTSDLGLLSASCICGISIGGMIAENWMLSLSRQDSVIRSGIQFLPSRWALLQPRPLSQNWLYIAAGFRRSLSPDLYQSRSLGASSPNYIAQYCNTSEKSPKGYHVTCSWGPGTC